jgi:prepilin-type N-terminal cleavage/methylation domain-containing protein/prepilin-type processing-associated H-X9-DG protein
MIRQLCQANRGTTSGFTLLELLVVISIMAILMSLLAPSLGSGRDQAKKLVCITNQQTLLRAFMFYADDNDGRLPGVDGSAASEFWWEAVDQYLDERVPENVFECTQDRMPKVLFCPNGMMPFPKFYMLGKIEVTNYFLNGVERDMAMGVGKEVRLGLFSGEGTISDPKSPGDCMMLGDSAHYNKIVDLDHPAAIEAFEAAGANMSFARERYHHRATAGFFHRGTMNIGYVDGHVAPLVGKSVSDDYAYDPSQWPMPMRNDPTLFYPRLRMPTATEEPFFWGPPYDAYKPKPGE